MTLLAVALLLLHDPEGADVVVNPKLITSLRAPRSSESKNFTSKARCMINTSDGKFVTVTETCATVRRLMEPPP
jgi:hypothetical protein